jgi:hypothetical protein
MGTTRFDKLAAANGLVCGPKGSEFGVIEWQDTLVTNSQVLALNTTPITVVDAVGTGYLCQFAGAYVYLNRVAPSFITGAGQDVVFVNQGGSQQVSQTVDDAEWGSSTDVTYWFNPSNPDSASGTNKLTDNGSIKIKILVGNWAGGGGNFKVRCFYRKIDSSQLSTIS